MRFCTLTSLLLAAFFTCLPRSSDAADRVYYGTYTRGDSKGIYFSEWDKTKGSLTEPVLAGELENPSFLKFSSDGKFLYAVSETGEGSLHAFRVLGDGTIEPVNHQPTGGGAPCHLSITSDGKMVAIANYVSGDVVSYRILDDGSLSKPVSTIQHKGSSIDPRRQKGPHAHSINFSNDDRFAYAADLGTDRIYVYSVDSAAGSLIPAGETVIKPGSGPRHFSIHPEGQFAYVINELSLTVEAFSVDAETGKLTSLQTISTLPPGVEKEGSTAEVVSHPNGKFLYGSNRGHDTIVVYRIEDESGILERIENEPIRGAVPRNFNVSPDGSWLIAAGQKSNTVAVFAIDQETGALSFSGNMENVEMPVCVRFAPRP